MEFNRFKNSLPFLDNQVADRFLKEVHEGDFVSAIRKVAKELGEKFDVRKEFDCPVKFMNYLAKSNVSSRMFNVADYMVSKLTGYLRGRNSVIQINMKKVSLVFRGRNSRRNFRGLNSETELVGKEVEVTEGNEVSQAEVAEVTVDKEGTTTLTLENGDEVELNKSEAEDLVDTGQAVAEDEPKKDPEEFEVTRDVKDADGNETEVTTTVTAESEGDAVKTVETLDSRRGRNARHYRVNSRFSNSRRRNSVYRGRNSKLNDRMFARRDDSDWQYEFTNICGIDPFKYSSFRDFYEACEQHEDLCSDEQLNEIDRIYSEYFGGEINSKLMGGGNNSRKRNTKPEVAEPKEFKVVREVECEGKKMRKIASVTAPTVEEAIEAVQAKDNADNIKAEGYAELVDEEPKSMVTINSDVDEVLEEPKTEEIKEEMPEAPVEEPKTEEIKEEMPEAPVEEPKPVDDDEIDRTSNSYKGVADFVSRRYGIKI